MFCFSSTRTGCYGLVCLPATFATQPSQAVTIDASRYAAVAYSTSTGEFGYAWDQPTRGMAERTALSDCEADDAKIVGWVQGGWLVLAISDDFSCGVGWEFGDRARMSVAADRAFGNCKKQGGRVTTIVYPGSSGVLPIVLFGEESTEH